MGQWLLIMFAVKVNVQSFMNVLLVVCHMLHVFSFEVDYPFSGQSVLWDQRGSCCLLFLTPLIFLLRKIASMHWSESVSYNKPFELLCSQDLGFRDQWSRCRNSFCQSMLLTTTLQPFSLPFNVQVMISVGFYMILNLASMSVDGCYLYTTIHYGMLWRDWGIRSVPKGCRPDPESKAIDTYE